MKSYTDSRSPKQLSKISTELADVQRIMVQNIEDVIQRGEQLSGELAVFRIQMFSRVHTLLQHEVLIYPVPVTLIYNRV